MNIKWGCLGVDLTKYFTLPDHLRNSIHATNIKPFNKWKSFQKPKFKCVAHIAF